MTRPFRFAVQGMDLRDRDGVVALARRAEELGYAELWSFDHIGSVDPFVPLLIAAEATTTLRVGPLVLDNELHHPVLLARTAATVDRLTGGRLVLGMGTGYMESEHDAIGSGLRPPGPRVERLEESLLVVRALLDHGGVRFDGRHHRIDLDDLGVRPVQPRVPVLLGGHGRRVVGLAARHADVYQLTGLTHGAGGVPEPSGFDVRHAVERARWLEEAAGARADQIERSVLVQATTVGKGAEAAVATAADRLGMDESVVAGSPFLLFGSVAQVVDELERRRELLGISHVVVRELESFAPVVAALAGR